MLLLIVNGLLYLCMVTFLLVVIHNGLCCSCYPARAARAGLSGQLWCPYICGRKKYLNRTLEIDSPFQTFAVGLLV